MNRALILVSDFAVSAAGTSYSQQSPGDRVVGLALYLQEGYATLKLNLTEAAEQMDEANYTFRPGSTTDVRTYGQVFAHVASSQFSTCASVVGRQNPSENEKLEEELASKEEVQAALADSFALCDDAFEDLTEAGTNEIVKYGEVQITRGALLSYLLVHSSEMYGISTVYLRSKDLVPPSTQRERRARARQ